MSFHAIDQDASAAGHRDESVTIGKGIEGTQLLLMNQAANVPGLGARGDLHSHAVPEQRVPGRTRAHARALPCESVRFRSRRPYLSHRDMGRYLPDGASRFVGRNDVGNSNFEASASGSPKLRRRFGTARASASVAVVVGPDDLGRESLLAYVAPSDASSAPVVRQLRDLLKSRLPGLHDSTAFVMLEQLPLTPNGKIDRKALPPPEFGRAQAGQVYEAPRSLAEHAITRIWTEVFEGKQVGIHDNFFDLGGHSLLAIRFVSLLRERAGVDLPIRMVFESPTPATLAERLTLEIETTASATRRQPNRCASSFVRTTPQIARAQRSAPRSMSSLADSSTMFGPGRVLDPPPSHSSSASTIQARAPGSSGACKAIVS
jgi:hypothetical protein